MVVQDHLSQQRSAPVKRKKVIWTSFGTFLLVVVLPFALFAFFNFHTVQIKGKSMEPTFNSGERLLVTSAYWLVGDIKKNDIIVVNSPSGDSVIKRVYAVGGDTVDFFNAPESWDITQGEYRVPPGTYYIVGDNRPQSEDSRVFGPISRDRVLGKVIRLAPGFEKNPQAAAQNPE
ncbi:MAG: signal peptidase I [Fimbriimonadaceae bacterium]|jgi:signal peptidase I|nr:signal peptidase I [Fimbriimonadaceae bacterium]